MNRVIWRTECRENINIPGGGCNLYRLSLFLLVVLSLCLRHDSYIYAHSSTPNKKNSAPNSNDFTSEKSHHGNLKTGHTRKLRVSTKRYDLQNKSDDTFFTDGDTRAEEDPISSNSETQYLPTSTPSSYPSQEISSQPTIKMPGLEPTSIPSREPTLSTLDPTFKVSIEEIDNIDNAQQNEKILIESIDMKTMSVILKVGMSSTRNEEYSIQELTQLNVIRKVSETLESHMASRHQEKLMNDKGKITDSFSVYDTVLIKNFVVGREISNLQSNDYINRVEPLVFHSQEEDNNNPENKVSSLQAEIMLWCVAEYQQLNRTSKYSDGGNILSNNAKQELAAQHIRVLQESLFSFQDDAINNFSDVSRSLQQVINDMGSLKTNITDIQISFNPSRFVTRNNRPKEIPAVVSGQTKAPPGSSSSSTLKIVGIIAMCCTCLASLSIFTYIARQRLANRKSYSDVSIGEPSYAFGQDTCTYRSQQSELSEQPPEDSIVKEFQQAKQATGLGGSSYSQFEPSKEPAMSSAIGHSVLESLLSSCNPTNLNDIIETDEPMVLNNNVSQRFGIQHHDITISNNVVGDRNGGNFNETDGSIIENNSVDLSETKSQKERGENGSTVSSVANSLGSVLTEFSPIQSLKGHKIVQQQQQQDNNIDNKNPAAATTPVVSSYDKNPPSSPVMKPPMKQQKLRQKKFININTPPISEDEELKIKSEKMLATKHSQDILDEFEDHVAFMINRNGACEEI